MSRGRLYCSNATRTELNASGTPIPSICANGRVQATHTNTPRVHNHAGRAAGAFGCWRGLPFAGSNDRCCGSEGALRRAAFLKEGETTFGLRPRIDSVQQANCEVMERKEYP